MNGPSTMWFPDPLPGQRNSHVSSTLLLLLLSVLATPALALPAPMSEQELTDKSDLVATVRVLSVSCIVMTKDDKTGEDLPAYLAKVRLMEVKKGDAKKGDEILVTWRAIPKDMRRAVDRQLLSRRGRCDPSHQEERRGELRLDLVERQGRGHQGAGKHRAARDAGRDFRRAEGSTDQHPL